MSGHYFSDETIAAIATSLAGDGGVGIIRLSGKHSLPIAQLCTKGFETPKSRYMHRVEFLETPQDRSDATAITTRAVLDDGLAVFFPSGGSFTGEDVVELQMHGGRFALQQLLKEVLRTKMCRLALPGEFSFRAVRNGQMSVNQAQAINQLVKARSQYEIWSARQNISGERGREFVAIAEKLRHLLALTELSIDFIDQDVEVISSDVMSAEVETILSQVNQLLTKLELAQRIAQGPLVVFAGDPNAGKSTLFNALLAEDRAIVSSEPGTTRDVITEDLLLGPYRLRLADTAGLRRTANSIEQQGIQKTEALLDQGDLVVLLLDGEHLLKLSEPEIKSVLLKQPLHKVGFVLITKSDLMQQDKGLKILDLVKASVDPSLKVVTASARTGDGIASLLKSIQECLDSKFGLGLSTPLPTEYQLQMVMKCRAGLMNVQNVMQGYGLDSPELISASLSEAVNALEGLVGETTPDTILSKIFSEFCIGK